MSLLPANSVTPAGNRLLTFLTGIEKSDGKETSKHQQTLLQLLKDLRSSFNRLDLPVLKTLKASKIVLGMPELTTEIEAIEKGVTASSLEVCPAARLSRDVWIKIFSYHYPQRSLLSWVCKAWNSMANDPITIAKVIARGDFKIPLDRLKQLLLSCGIKIENLDLSALLTSEDGQKLNPGTLKELVTTCPSLKTLTLTGPIPLKQLLEVLTLHGNNITDLDLSGLLTHDDSQALKPEQLKDIITRCPNLKSLILFDTFHIEGEHLIDVFMDQASLSQLEKLGLVVCFGITQEHVDTLQATYPKLKDGIIFYPWGNENMNIYRLIQRGMRASLYFGLSPAMKEVFHNRSFSEMVRLGVDYDILVTLPPSMLTKLAEFSGEFTRCRMVESGLNVPKLCRMQEGERYLDLIIQHSDKVQYFQCAKKYDLLTIPLNALRLIFENERKIQSFMGYKVDLYDFGKLPPEEQNYLLAHDEGVCELLRYGVKLPSFLSASDEKRKIVLEQSDPVTRLVDSDGNPFDALIALEDDELKKVLKKYSRFDRGGKSAYDASHVGVQEYSEYSKDKRKILIKKIWALKHLLKAGIPPKILQNMPLKVFELVLNKENEITKLLECGLLPQDLPEIPFEHLELILGLEGNLSHLHRDSSLKREQLLDVDLLKAWQTAEEEMHFLGELNHGVKDLFACLASSQPKRQFILDNFKGVVPLLIRGAQLNTILQLSSEELQGVCQNFDAFSSRLRFPMAEWNVEKNSMGMLAWGAQAVASHLGENYVEAKPTDADKLFPDSKQKIAAVIVYERGGISLESFVKLEPDMRKKVLEKALQIGNDIREGKKFEELIEKL